MSKGIRWLLILCILSIGVHTAAAQDAPPQINLALQDLGERVGRTVTLGQMMLWTWNVEWYSDTSLGCPQPDQVYAPVSMVGYQFTLKYQGVTYDYRVAVDGSVVILCSVSPPSPATLPIADAPGVEPALPEVADEVCAAMPPLPLTAGMQARITSGSASNLRAQPGVTALRIGRVPPAQVFTVLDGPVCALDGLYWWQIQYDTLTGWIAQGQAGTYFVEMLPESLPPVEGLARITGETLSLLIEQARLDNTHSAALTATQLAVISADATTPGVWLYTLPLGEDGEPRRLATETPASAVAFAPDGTLLAVGDVTGALHFWDMSREALIFSFPAHTSAIRALAFSPDSLVMVSLDEQGALRMWGVPAGL